MPGDSLAGRGWAHAGMLLEADARRTDRWSWDWNCMLCCVAYLTYMPNLAQHQYCLDTWQLHLGLQVMVPPKDKSTATISSRGQASGVNPAPSMRGKFLEREILPEREKKQHENRRLERKKVPMFLQAGLL